MIEKVDKMSFIVIRFRRIMCLWYSFLRGKERYKLKIIIILCYLKILSMLLTICMYREHLKYLGKKLP